MTSRTVFVLLVPLAAACHSSSPAIAPPSLATKSDAPTAATAPDPLVDEARRARLSVVVMRGDDLVFTAGNGTVPRYLFAIRPVVDAMASKTMAEAALDNDQTGLVAPYGMLPSDEQHRRLVFEPLGIPASEHHAGMLSLNAAARIARVVLTHGVWNGRSMLSDAFVTYAMNPAKRGAVFEPIGEGEIVIVTSELFQRWRAISWLDRSVLSALAVLVDVPMSPSELGAALDAKLGAETARFKERLVAASCPLFEQRGWRTYLGQAAFGPSDAVVIVPSRNLVATFATDRDDVDLRGWAHKLARLEN